MKEKILGSLPLAACRLTLVARGLLLAARRLKLAARSLSLGALNEAFTILRVECCAVHGKVIGHKFLSAGHMLHSRLKAANSSCSPGIHCFVLAPGTSCW